jgi:hypothetical protein
MFTADVCEKNHYRKHFEETFRRILSRLKTAKNTSSIHAGQRLAARD